MSIDQKLGIYLKSSGTGLISQVVTKLAGFVAIWLLNQILMKEGYGNYEFALALTSMLLILGSGGLQYVAMYRISRIDEEPETLAGRTIAGALLGWSLILSLVVAVAVVYTAPLVASASGKPDLAFWVGSLAFLIPIRVATGVYRNWFRARQLVAESLLYGEMAPMVSRTIFLLGAWFAWDTPEGVIAAGLIGELLPIVAWFVWTPVNPFKLTGILSGWDVQYAAKLMFTRSLSLSVKRSDVIMMGALATSSATAGYVMASRLSMVLLVGHQLMNLILTPRIGRFLDKDAWMSIEQEYHQSRVLALMVALGGGVVFVFAGEWILTWFGDYAEAFPMLLILVATYVTHVSFGMCGGYLNIAGYAGWTLATTMAVLIINVGLNYLLIPILGGEGAALAMLVSFFSTNLLTAYLVMEFDDVKTYTLWLGVVTVVSVSALILAAYQQIPDWAGGIVLAGGLGVVIWKEIRFFESLARSLFRLFHDAQVENQ